ncbi:MAG: hypothetical protein R3C59_26760 [Planctomycetaceae bacterium]
MTTLATSFRATTIRRMAIRPLGGSPGWLEVKKSFRVVINFAPGIDFHRYQYRQFIKGSASIEEGSYTGAASVANWRSAGRTPISVNSVFGVPPTGLTPSFREDGAMEGGRVVHYGRQIPGTRQHGNVPEDRYFMDGGLGCYRATDNVGLEVPPGRTFVVAGRNVVRSGLRIRMNILFQGCIVDTTRSDHKLQTLHWSVRSDLVLP